MRGPGRIAQGLLTDATRPVGFRFDGRRMSGLAGDTLASALLANGVRVVGRGFKYHRPRGIVTAGPEEPCALIDVIGPDGREPNRLATTLALHQGLTAESQNRWPSLALDFGSVADIFARFLPAGFYYKTFMAPGWAWERVYEPLIRRAAGLGRLEPIVADHAGPAETLHEHADVLVVGAGAAGLAAAHWLGASGLRVLLAEQDVALGGGSLLDAGITCAGVIEVREKSLAAERAHALGVEVHAASLVTSVSGRRGVRAVRISDLRGRHRRWLQADCLLMSGGYSPVTSLASQPGAALNWREAIAAFTPDLAPAIGQVAGAARGVFGLAAAARAGERAAGAIAAELGRAPPGAGLAAELPPDTEATAITALWEVPARGKAFVDLQNDVTSADVRLAAREGYEHVEHMKRFTTHGMGTDQGRIGALVGSAVLAQARGVPLAEVGLTKPG